MPDLICNECDNVVTECDNPNCTESFNDGDTICCLHTTDDYKHYCGVGCAVAGLTLANELTETQVSKGE